jgi:hypothetical protein
VGGGELKDWKSCCRFAQHLLASFCSKLAWAPISKAILYISQKIILGNERSELLSAKTLENESTWSWKNNLKGTEASSSTRGLRKFFVDAYIYNSFPEFELERTENIFVDDTERDVYPPIIITSICTCV